MARHRTQLIFGWAVQRQQHGEQPYWMGAVLAAMLGQIIRPAAASATRTTTAPWACPRPGAAMPGAFPLNLDPGRKPRHDNTDFKGYSAVVPIAPASSTPCSSRGKEIDFNGGRSSCRPAQDEAIGRFQWHRQPQRNRMKETGASSDRSRHRLQRPVASPTSVLPALTPFERNDLPMATARAATAASSRCKLIDPLPERPDFPRSSTASPGASATFQATPRHGQMQWSKIYEDCRQGERPQGHRHAAFASSQQKELRLSDVPGEN